MKNLLNDTFTVYLRMTLISFASALVVLIGGIFLGLREELLHRVSYFTREEYLLMFVVAPLSLTIFWTFMCRVKITIRLRK